MIAGSLALALGIGAAAPLQGVARDTAEPVIIELSLGRLANRTVAGYRLGATALLPTGAIFDLAEIRITAAGPDQMTAVLEPARTVISIDASRRLLSVGRTTTTLDSSEVLARDGELYLATGPLGRALGVEWAVNWGDLTAVAIDPSGLPIAARISRNWRRRIESGFADPSLPVFDLGIGPRRPVDGLVVDYGIFAPTGRPLAEAAYSTGIGLDVMGGSFTASAQTQSESGRNRIRTEVAWAGYWRHRTWLTQARIGDGYTSGPRPRTVRGVSFGNAPLLRPNEIGEVAFTGSLGPGWQIEAWRGGRRIGFDSVNALGKYSIDAPIAYGENPVEFVAYGPFGEVRRFSRAFRVDANRVAARRLEYGVSIGACRTDRCDATVNTDVRYGLSNRWTAQAGLDHFSRADSVGNLFHPYAAVSGSVGNAFGVQAELVANAIARAGVRYQPSAGLIVGLEGTRFARGVQAPLLTPEGRTSQVTLTGFYRPRESLGSFYFDGSVDVARSATGSVASGRLGGSYHFREVQLLPAVRWQRSRSGSIVQRTTRFELNTYLLPLPRLGAFFGQLTARSYLETTASLGAEAASLHLSRNLNRALRVEVGGGWGRNQGASLSLNLAANFAAIRGLASLTATRAGTVGSQYLQGSLLYDRAARQVHLAAGPSIERAGVSGRVFLDANGNDRFDAGDELLPNVRLSIGMESRISDARGEYRLWNLTPYEPALIAVDSATLASPLWIPARGAMSVEPAPNRFRIVDIPIAPGGVVDGRVVRAADSSGAPGVTVILTHLDSGTSRMMTTFSDGAFYAMGVRPGRYRLTLDPRVAARLGVTAEPVEFVMAAAIDGATVGDLQLRLR